MKAKLKETKKDINIDIVIENNLMSKNIFDKPKKKKRPTRLADPNKDNAKSLEGTTNQSIPRLMNEYMGIMASRDLYNMNRVEQLPFNLNQYLTAPYNVPRLQNNNGYAMIGNLSSTQQDEVSEDEEEEDEEALSEAGGTGEDAGEDAGGSAGAGGDEEEEEEPLSTQPPNVSVMSVVPSAANITKQQLLRSIIDDPEKEDAFVNQNKNKANWEKTRNAYITMIMQPDRRLQLKRNTVMTYKIGQYIRDFRPEYWKKLMDKSK
jgi:hypothetical protein